MSRGQCTNCAKRSGCIIKSQKPDCAYYEMDIPEAIQGEEQPAGRGLCLSKALDIINGGAEKIGPNGKPEDSFQTTADLWNAYCKGRGMITHFEKSDTAMMMDLLKTARFTGQKYNPDNCIDKAGYTGLADDFKKEEVKTDG